MNEVAKKYNLPKDVLRRIEDERRAAFMRERVLPMEKVMMFALGVRAKPRDAHFCDCYKCELSINREMLIRRVDEKLLDEFNHSDREYYSVKMRFLEYCLFKRGVGDSKGCDELFHYYERIFCRDIIYQLAEEVATRNGRPLPQNYLAHHYNGTVCRRGIPKSEWQLRQTLKDYARLHRLYG